MIEIPSIMGNLQYYCKAKDKKTITKRLIKHLCKSAVQKMPVILISAGELTQKRRKC